MFISDFAIQRPIVTITAMVALVAFGIAALVNLNTDEFPDIQQPIVGVTILYPGASPETVEREIVDPIEEAFSSISGLDWAKTQASATDGLAQFTVFFDFEKDVQEASQDIRDAISTERDDLPTEMEEPVLTRFDPSQQSVLSLALTSSQIPAATLTRIADPMIVRDLRTVPGVAQVSVVGGLERELTVQIRPADMQAAGVSVADVVQALESQNLAAPVGRLNGALDERAIRLKGRLDTPEDFSKLVLAERDGQVIRLGQVATVLDGTEEQRDQALFNGRDAVGIEVLKAKGYSTTQVTDIIHRHVAELQKRMPPGAKLEIVLDAGTRVHHAVQNVQEALIEGALLTVLVVFLFLNSWRSTVITGLALPVSVLASFIAVWAFGFTLNTMSLMGLSLAIGILIDDAIVVRENIVRHIEMGKDHYEASREGTDEIGLAVAATTFSIVAVFIPVAFMYGISGQWFKPFALTIACSVLVSLFVSFSLDPMLSAYWPDPQTEAHERRNPIARTLDRFNQWFDRMADRYKDLIAWALDHRLMMIGLALATFVAALTIPARGILAAFAMLAGLWAIFWILDRPWLARLGVIRGVGAKVVEPARGRGAHGSAAAAHPSDRPGRGRLRAGERPQRDQHDRGGASRVQPGLHPDQGGGGGAPGSGAPRGRLHLHHGRNPGTAEDPLGGSGPGVREAGSQGRSRPASGGAGAGAPGRDEADRRGAGLGLHQRLRRGHEGDPDPDEGRRRAGADEPGAARRGRRSSPRYRGRWMSASPPEDRSPSSRSSSTAGSRARSASPSGRWRSRCDRHSPASMPATGLTPRARPATSRCAWLRRPASG